MATVTINTARELVPPESVITFQGGTISLVRSGQSFTALLDGTPSSSVDGTVISYIWQRQKDGGNWIDIASTTIPTTSNIVSVTGVYKYRLKVIDSNGLEDTSSEITLSFTKEAAIQCDAKANGFNFTTNITTTFGFFILDATDSIAGGPDDTIVSYFWEITAQPNGANATVLSETSPRTTTSNLIVQGLYSIVLTIVSSNGTTDSVLIRADVKNQDENGNYF